MSSSVWLWSEDGKHPGGLLEFLADGKIKFRYGARDGEWSYHNDERTFLRADFGAEQHYFFYDARRETATLVYPSRYPASEMWWLKGSLMFKLCVQEYGKS